LVTSRTAEGKTRRKTEGGLGARRLVVIALIFPILLSSSCLSRKDEGRVPINQPDPAKAEVFICYRHVTAGPLAALLHRHLLEHELDVFVDFDKIQGGDLWSDAIDKALQGSSLVVGVVLMTSSWFSELKPDGEVDVVRHEVRSLLDRNPDAGLTVFPLFVDDGGSVVSAATVDGRPADLRMLPPRPAPEPGDDEQARRAEVVDELYEKLSRLQVIRREATGDFGMKDVAAQIALKVQAAALGRPVYGGFTAKELPPLPLAELSGDARARRGLRYHAEIASTYDNDPQPLVALGQDALLARDFPRARSHLERACAQGRDVVKAKPGDVDAEVWYAHALNMFVVASLRGERPRRLEVSEATALVQDVLFAAIARESAWTCFAGLGRAGDEPRADVRQRSAAYVADLTIRLLWLLWWDFFVNRNVLLPELHEGTRQRLIGQLDDLADRLDVSEAVLGKPAWADDEQAFLVKYHLDGLTEPLPTEPAQRARRMMVTGLTNRETLALGEAR
jgi:hypothetical protein